MFTDEEIEHLRRAGKIGSEMRARAREMVRSKASVLELCEGIENAIRQRGAEPAFPCNVDINEVGAHYTSPPKDPKTIPPNSIVKVDIGVHIEGYISDTATSVCLNPEHLILQRATEEALEKAIDTMRPGVKVSAVGAAVQFTIEKYGLKPIRNLTGHNITRYVVHSGKHIPNVRESNGLKVEQGDLFAIEPFATTNEGAGEVKDGGEGFIYRVAKEKAPKDKDPRMLFEAIKNNFRSLPFARRWVERISPIADVEKTFQSLLRERFIHGYPMLVERKGQPVGQSEHTVLVTENGCEVMTR